MSEWVNRLDFTQRTLVVQMYLNGVGISAITNIYQVHHSSVRYHLKKAGVYVKGQYGSVNMPTIKKYNPKSSLDFYNTKGQKISVVKIPNHLEPIEDPYEKNFPKSYKDYVQREKDRNSILLKHGITNLTVKLPDPDHDADPFYKRRRFSPSNIDERRKKIKIPDTIYLRIEDSESK